MLGKKYTVKRGDSLWSIAGNFWGDSTKWRLIHEHNNKPVVSAATKTIINNPDLIFVGQVIYIPLNSSGISSAFKTQTGQSVKQSRVKPISGNSNEGKTTAKHKIYSIPFKYDFQDLPEMTVVSASYVATIRITGAVNIQSQKLIDFISISNQIYEISAKREADLVFGKMVSEAKVGFNPATKQITFECGITTYAHCSLSPVVGTALTMSSTTGLPAVKASIKYPPLKGQILNHFFMSDQFTVEIEVTQNSSVDRPSQSSGEKSVAGSILEPIPAQQTVTSAWDYLVRGALVVTATVLVVATIAEDVFTFGLGIADDTPCFAAAAGMFVLGVNRFKSVRGVVPVKVPSGNSNFSL